MRSGRAHRGGAVQVLPTGHTARHWSYLQEQCSKSGNRNYHRPDITQTSSTLTGAPRMEQVPEHMHPFLDRTLTVLEAKRVQVRAVLPSPSPFAMKRFDETVTHQTARVRVVHARDAAPTSALMMLCHRLSVQERMM